MKNYASLLLAAALSVAGLGLISTPAHAAEGAVLTVERVGATVRFDLTGGPVSETLRYMTTVWGEQNGGDLTTDVNGGATVTVALPRNPTSDAVSMVVARTSPVFEPIASVSTTVDPAEVTFRDLTITQRVDGGRQFVVTGAEPGETVTYKIQLGGYGVEPIVRTAIADTDGRAVLPFESIEPVTVTVTAPSGSGGPVSLSMVGGRPVASTHVYPSRGKDCATSAYAKRGFVYPGGAVTGLSAGQVLPLIEQAYGKTRFIAAIEADQSGRAVVPAHTLAKVDTAGRWVNTYQPGPVKTWVNDRRDPVLLLGEGTEAVVLVKPKAVDERTGWTQCKIPAVQLKPTVTVRASSAGKISASVVAWYRGEFSYEAHPASRGTVTVKTAKGKTVGTARITGGISTKVKVKRPAAGKAAVYRVVVKTAGKTVVKKVRVAGVPKVTAKVKGKQVVAKVRYSNRPLAKGSKVTVKVAGQKAKTATVSKAGGVSVKTKVKGKKKVRFVVRDANGKRLGTVVKVVKK